MDNLYANVPRDLTRVKSKLFMNLTKRQILCFSAAIAAGLPLYFLIRKAGNATMGAMIMILVMLPFFFLAMYERNGQPLEVVLGHFISARFKRPRIRKYRTRNRYHRKVIVKRPGNRKENTAKKISSVKKTVPDPSGRKNVRDPGKPDKKSDGGKKSGREAGRKKTRKGGKEDGHVQQKA